ncbi:AAA family ATPase [Flavobacterium columnare]|uniref:AAA family ATPase n=1 Tax=Flavobacterium columnare TaxID=996 RepID=UPI0040347000
MTQQEIEIIKNCTIKAIKYLDKNQWDAVNNSRTGDLVYNGKFYPTKPILKEIEKQIENEKLEIYLPVLTGGEATFLFFEKLGFEIKRKNQIAKLIESYKLKIKETQLQDEVYKWQLVDEFKGKPNLDNPDLLQELKNIKYSNLIYAMGMAVIHHLIKEKPEEIRIQFKKLFNETSDLTERVKSFNNETLTIYRAIGETLQHHQDERTIATYLTFYNPEKYTLYKFSFYKKLCQLLNIKVAGKNEKYSHYLSLVNQIIEDYINEDSELINLVKSYLPNYYDGSNHLLLVQDILYQMLDKGIEEIDIEDFSVFKISMGEFNIEELNELIKNKKVCVHRDTKSKGRSSESQGSIFENRMKIGDYFYLTHGNGVDKIKLIGRITSTASLTEYNDYGNDGWLERSFELIANAEIKSKYNGLDKWWTPNNNSTFIQIKPNEIKEANKLIFEPYFRTKLISNEELIIDRLENSNQEKSAMEIKVSLNQILYGAPGTGKTYTTKKLAVEIIEGKEFTDRETILSKYDELVKSNQIQFTTFHQSMSYEDFIEGIKPETIDNKVTYEVKDGIFKQIADYANSKSESNFDEAYTNLIKEILEKGNDYLVLNTPKNKTFRINVNSNNNLNLYTSENINKQGTLTKEKLFKQVNGFQEFNGWEGYVTSVIQYLKENHNLKINDTTSEKKYVLIIDEINRGNVSSIFGELITLLEVDKRKGSKEEIEVVLPYSHDKFSVPDNLYIIGTMNTADRSVEALDTALRRRFSFIEMPSKPNLLLTEHISKGIITDSKGNEINLISILTIINERIELLIDKDHQIGHSFLINTNSFDELKLVFKDCIIPLLEEYFFGDFGKIGLVIGGEFIRHKNTKPKFPSNFKYGEDNDISSFTDKIVYEFTSFANWTAKTFTSIYE